MIGIPWTLKSMLVQLEIAHGISFCRVIMEFEVWTAPTLLKLNRGSWIARLHWTPGTLWDVLPALFSAQILGHVIGKWQLRCGK